MKSRLIRIVVHCTFGKILGAVPSLVNSATCTKLSRADSLYILSGCFVFLCCVFSIYLQLEVHCKCEVRDFPAASDLPLHTTHWSNFAFKSIIVSVSYIFWAQNNNV